MPEKSDIPPSFVALENLVSDVRTGRTSGPTNFTRHSLERYNPNLRMTMTRFVPQSHQPFPALSLYSLRNNWHWLPWYSSRTHVRRGSSQNHVYHLSVSHLHTSRTSHMLEEFEDLHVSPISPPSLRTDSFQVSQHPPTSRIPSKHSPLAQLPSHVLAWGYRAEAYHRHFFDRQR